MYWLCPQAIWTDECFTIKWIYLSEWELSWRKTSSCNWFVISRDILNFPNQVSPRNEGQYLLHNLRYRTSLLNHSTFWNITNRVLFNSNSNVRISMWATARGFTEKTGCLHFFKKETREKVFCCVFCKISRTPILQIICEWLLLGLTVLWVNEKVIFNRHKKKSK